MAVRAGDEKRKISRREAGRCTLEALKPSRMEVLLTLNLDGECLGLCELGSGFVFCGGFLSWSLEQFVYSGVPGTSFWRLVGITDCCEVLCAVLSFTL